MHHINASFNDRQMERLNEISSCLGINRQAVIRMLLTYYYEQVIGDDDDDDDDENYWLPYKKDSAQPSLYQNHSIGEL